MAQARRVSDECAFMLLGELIEHRATEDLFSDPRNPKTAEYIKRPLRLSASIVVNSGRRATMPGWFPTVRFVLEQFGPTLKSQP